MLTGRRNRHHSLRGTVASALVALLTLATLTGVPGAQAAPAGGPATRAALLTGPGAGCPPTQTNCDVWDDDPGEPGGGGNNGGGNNGGGGGDGGPRKCVLDGEPVRCYDDVLGWFNSADGCYYKLQDPQPDGTPEGKLWYTRTCDRGAGNQESVLLDAPPPGFGAPPDPDELAREALASITLEQPRVGIAPRPRNGAGLVGLPVWLWTSSAPTTWGPQSASASDRGLTVTITAEVKKIVWDLGNGDTETCHHPGVPYDGQGGKSPTCGYDGYPRSSGDGKFRVFATTHWRVPWESTSGVSGVITTTRVGPSAWIEIDELQVVTR